MILVVEYLNGMSQHLVMKESTEDETFELEFTPNGVADIKVAASYASSKHVLPSTSIFPH